MHPTTELIAWGAYLGVACLLLSGSLVAWFITRFKVALQGVAMVAVSTLFVMVHIGWIGVEGPLQDRLTAHVAVLTASFLLFYLSLWLGGPHQRRKLVVPLMLLCALVPGWWMPPRLALWLAAFTACVSGCIAIQRCVRAIQAGDFPAWVMGPATVFMTASVISLSVLGLLPELDVVPLLHGVAALSASAYLTLAIWALWLRYARMLELRMARRRGPHWDPLTRMSTSLDTVKMLGQALERAGKAGSLTGVIVVSIANLRPLERLHGDEAVNQALFEFSSRLKRLAPRHNAIGRLDRNKFMLVVERLRDRRALDRLALSLRHDLARSTPIGPEDAESPEYAEEMTWKAQVGIGVLVVNPRQNDPLSVLETCRSLAASALGTPGRIASLDEYSGDIREFSSSDTSQPGVAA